ncbi:ThuA domain-containing protein [Pelagicoccus sp. SDUM812005]|uniref:ThuA domain-containing protein n=1 Tax=Pelagicoccus sp. SDUM812005 TaxID=3041257 RepID=UPI0028103268|nr:ThuA domain-containing protein [Pelagicoccus sp. SDUM812005]MDQ8179635.1 ThuA domain-containing protein [Pelagicoccus sp. SDUM812005]
MQKSDSQKIKVLLLTGQSNQWHNWKVSSQALQAAVGGDGMFEVDTLVSPAAGGDFSGFAPAWSDYDVVLLDYEGDRWPEECRAAFVRYMEEGGGLVSFHASDNAFPDWPEFNEMIGVGGWGGRDESSGPKVRWRKGSMVLDPGPGEAMHPEPFEYLVETRSPEHPVMQGLPEAWLHAIDEQYSQLRGPAQNLTVLATAIAGPEIDKGTGENEPMLMAIEYGKGRIFHTTLGHVGADDTETPPAMKCVGFLETLFRGLEWAATGAVTRPVPADFPGTDFPSVR